MDIVKIDSLPREIILMIIMKNTSISQFVCKNVNKKWNRIIHEHCKKYNYHYLMCANVAFVYFNEAARGGFISILKWLKNERRVTNHVLDTIAEENQLESLKYLNELGDINNQELTFTVKAHHFELIKWVHTNTNIRWSHLVYASAAKCVEILKYLYIKQRSFDNIPRKFIVKSFGDDDYDLVLGLNTSFTINKNN